jgi:hypothetical protein
MTRGRYVELSGPVSSVISGFALGNSFKQPPEPNQSGVSSYQLRNVERLNFIGFKLSSFAIDTCPVCSALWVFC